MNGWFILILLWLAIEAGVVLGKNGEQKEGTYSFGATFVSYAILVFLIFKSIQTGF